MLLVAFIKRMNAVFYEGIFGNNSPVNSINPAFRRLSDVRLFALAT